MVTLSFMLSAGIGALAGCVISPVTQTQYDMGAPLAIKGFAVAILGGLGNSMAAVAAGLLLGLLEAFSGQPVARWPTRRPSPSWSCCWSWSSGRAACSPGARCSGLRAA